MVIIIVEVMVKVIVIGLGIDTVTGRVICSVRVTCTLMITIKDKLIATS